MTSSLLVFFDLEELCGAWSLIAWSDSCAGQSKNFYMIAFWQTLLALERFLKIEHKFPEVGYRVNVPKFVQYLSSSTCMFS